MINLITQRDEKGVQRARGYATVEYSSTIEDENIIKITEENLASIFETAKSNGETLDGAASSIDAAIDDPLSYIDYLILDTKRYRR